MELGDLALVERWLGEPHVARWYLAGSSLDGGADDIRQSVTDDTGDAHARGARTTASPSGGASGTCAEVDPEWAAEMGAEPGDCGIDYAIGDPGAVGGGVGDGARRGAGRARAGCAAGLCGSWRTPTHRTAASRRVLEKNGFSLVAVKTMDSEPSDEPMAIYRLPASARTGAG